MRASTKAVVGYTAYRVGKPIAKRMMKRKARRLPVRKIGIGAAAVAGAGTAVTVVRRRGRKPASEHEDAVATEHEDAVAS